MKKIFFILLLLHSLANVVKAQETKSRILSYSQLFAEMLSSEENYRLSNASIQYNAATDLRFLETDSVQLAGFDTIQINCQVYFDDVFFQNTPDELDTKTGTYLPEISFQKILFTDSLTFSDSKIEIKSIRNCSFLSAVTFTTCDFPDGITINQSTYENGLALRSSEFQGDIGIKNTKIHKNAVFSMLKLPMMNINHCLINKVLLRWTEASRIIFKENTSTSKIEIKYNTIKQLNIVKNQLSDLTVDSARLYTSLMSIDYNKLESFWWSQNRYELSNRYVGCLLFSNNTITNKFYFANTDFPNYITFRRNNILGSFKFAQGCHFAKGAYLYETYFNERSTIDWRNLKGKMYLSDYYGLRQFPESMDSIQSYGLLERELGNVEYCEALIKSKRTFFNVFKTQGLMANANEVLVEIKDLETAIWKHNYQANETIKSYFNWKMNVFLKKFSAYGTDPVIAIIYSLKVIFLFALIYLFFHNDWDIGGKKKIGKRLGFISTYFQVNKGLSELDKEQRIESEVEVNRLKSENEVSKGKIPKFFTKVIRWYIQSNLISDKLREFALNKIDILSGTYSKLPKKQKRKVAILSGAWFIGFILYTFLQKMLNALTLSLNAFTTLGFGNIPTKGLSRYIVIVQGFIGWVLMTIFSVTLISQLIQ